MKGFIAFLLVVVVALCAYNWLQIRSLREEIARLEQKVDQPRSGVTDAVVAQAISALARAREALASADTEKARAAFDDARQKLDAAARTAGEKAAPTVRWLQDQAAGLGRQLEERMGSHR